MTSNANISVSEPAHSLPRMGVTQATWKRSYQVVLLVTDGLMLLLAFALAYWLRFYGGITLFQAVIPSINLYMRLVAVLIPVWLVVFALLRLYNFQNLLSGASEYVRAFHSCTIGMMLVVVLSFIEPTFIIARGWLVMSWVLSSGLVCSNRWFLRRLAQALRQYGWFVTPTLIVGTNAEAIALATQLRHSLDSGLLVLGFIDEMTNIAPAQRLRTLLGLPVLGTLDQMTSIVQQRRAEEIIIATTALSREQLLETTLQLAEMPAVNLSLSSGFYEIFTTNLSITTRNAVPLLNFNRMRLDPVEMLLKTLLDYTIALVGALLLLPLIGLLGLLIKLDSPGPIFYRRRVLGMGGQAFDAFKFRTMVVNGDELLANDPALHAEFKTKHKLKTDPRVTRIGHWLRRTSLDELPQLLNILCGQMSLVGPRMITPAEAEQYGRLKQNLLTVKPGLTGLWQVSGRSDLAYAERVRLDMHYIRNYSLGLDLQILFFQTLPAVFRGRGAY